MGIKNLIRFIKNHVPDQIQTVSLNQYAGKVLAIDTSIYLYKFKYTSPEDPERLFIKQVMHLRRHKIKPFYIFDGKPPPEKNDVIIGRANERQRKEDLRTVLTNMIENSSSSTSKEEQVPPTPIINDDKYALYKNMAPEELKKELENIPKPIIITAQYKANVKRLFDMMGIPYVVAQGEAERLCAKLNRMGVVYGCISEDTDILANGGVRFITGYSNTSNKVVEYNLDGILEKLELSYEQFVDICILCGCDYTGKIYGIYEKNVLDFIQKDKCIEAIIERRCIAKGEGIYYRKGYRNYNITGQCDFVNARHIFIEGLRDEEVKAVGEVRLRQPNFDNVSESDQMSLLLTNAYRKKLMTYYEKYEKNN
jgi:flap endonuclease-1